MTYLAGGVRRHVGGAGLVGAQVVCRSSSRRKSTPNMRCATADQEKEMLAA